MPMVKVNDINMYYEIQGKGEPLVLIVGFSTDISEWRPIIDWLSKKYQVAAFDNRGAGRSDKPDIPYSIEMMADDTAGLMEKIGIGQATILGISMGGRIALELAIRHPKMVKKMVLVSTSAKSVQRKWLLRLLGFISYLPIFRSKHPQPYYAHVRQRQASANFDCTDSLDKIQIPTLIMHGKKDRMVPYELAKETNKGLRGSKILTFEGGHIFFFMKERQQFLNAIAEFLGA
jgi:pimeloyl-ACP methyl ester carboxylesterase